MNTDPVVDPWRLLRQSTQARIGLGRSGHALPTSALLAFQAAHAVARDAVHEDLDVDSLTEQLGHPPLVVESAAPDRTTFLQRPDLGRQLSTGSPARLVREDCDVAFVLADGLSARAVHQHGVALMRATCELLTGWTVARTVIARHARVALGDEVGALISARIVVMLIGERPGLSASDSLGAYLTYEPRIGRLDSERNCVSNVRPPVGQSISSAARTISGLLIRARERRLTGTGLKDESASVPAIPADGA
jgi:ethanolamine ammonia-lyase small subunit